MGEVGFGKHRKTQNDIQVKGLDLGEGRRDRVYPSRSKSDLTRVAGKLSDSFD